MSDLNYHGPRPGSIRCTLTLNKNAPEVDVFPSEQHGIIARMTKNKAVGVCWSDVVHQLRWALERSPEMRADVQGMLNEIEGADVSAGEGQSLNA